MSEILGDELVLSVRALVSNYPEDEILHAIADELSTQAGIEGTQMDGEDLATDLQEIADRLHAVADDLGPMLEKEDTP